MQVFNDVLFFWHQEVVELLNSIMKAMNELGYKLDLEPRIKGHHRFIFLLTEMSGDFIT